MARPKKIDSKELIRLVEEFFAGEAAGDPKRLKCSLLEQYAGACGMEVKAYDFRRDEEVRKRIEELKASPLQVAVPSAAIAYKNLDVAEMIRKSPDLEALKRSLLQMDAYWKNVYESAASLLQKNRELVAQRKDGEADLHSIKEEHAALSKQLKEAAAETRRLSQENTYLRKLLRDYLYPALAEELLREGNLPVKANTTVKPSAFLQLIEGKKPSPFPGTQMPEKKPLTREERLLEQMKAQVSEDGV